MADLETFWASGFWKAGFWADNFWAHVRVAPEVPQGGHRIYDPDEQKVKTRPLRKREREAIDRAFRERVAPRYVRPEPKPVAPPVKRLRPFVPPSFTFPDPPKPDRITAAKQFLALDAIEAYLDQAEQDAPVQRAYQQHLAAQRHAKFLEQEQQRRAQKQRATEFRLAEESRRAREAWLALEAERQRQADEDELMGVLLIVHDIA